PIAAVIVWFLVAAAYEIGLVGTRGRTIGKMICGLTVVRDDGVTLPGFGPATIRYAVTLLYGIPALPAIGFILSIATIVMAFATPLRQTLHDKAARTVVVKSSSLV